jgi:hypothetical protein
MSRHKEEEPANCAKARPGPISAHGDRCAPMELDDWYPYQETLKHPQLMLDAAACVPKDPSAWADVEKALGIMLRHVVGIITEMAFDRSRLGTFASPHSYDRRNERHIAAD